MSLMNATLGQEVTITSCEVQGNIKHHLDNLGLLPGQKVTPILKSAGNIIIQVHDGRLALDKHLASKIAVQ